MVCHYAIWGYIYSLCQVPTVPLLASWTTLGIPDFCCVRPRGCVCKNYIALPILLWSSVLRPPDGFGCLFQTLYISWYINFARPSQQLTCVRCGFLFNMHLFRSRCHGLGKDCLQDNACDKLRVVLMTAPMPSRYKYNVCIYIYINELIFLIIYGYYIYVLFLESQKCCSSTTHPS